MLLNEHLILIQYLPPMINAIEKLSEARAQQTKPRERN